MFLAPPPAPHNEPQLGRHRPDSNHVVQIHSEGQGTDFSNIVKVGSFPLGRQGRRSQSPSRVFDTGVKKTGIKHPMSSGQQAGFAGNFHDFAFAALYNVL